MIFDKKERIDFYSTS